MRYLLLLLLLSNIQAEETFDLDAYVFGKSYHTNRHIHFNETNPGLALGIGYEMEKHLDVIATTGIYKDSYSDTATFAVVGFRIIFIGERKTFHTTLGGSIGYIKGSTFNGLGMLPVASIGYNRVDLCFTGDPTGSDNQTGPTAKTSRTASIACFLKVNLLKF
jgi:hypothetical protein